MKTGGHAREVGQHIVASHFASAHGTRGCSPSRRSDDEVGMFDLREQTCQGQVAVKRGLKCKKEPTVALSANMLASVSSGSLKQRGPLHPAPPCPLGNTTCLENLVSSLPHSALHLHRPTQRTTLPQVPRNSDSPHRIILKS